ncbi:MAG: alpha/beta fold hydrolase [Moraxellaceae bacterium]
MSALRHLFRLPLLLVLVLLTGCIGLPPASPRPTQYTVYPGTTQTPTLLQTRDGLTLFGQWWLPPEETPRAVVLLLHGTAAHVGAYTPWAEFLNLHGYAMFAFDMRGWGQSQGFGRRAFVRSHDDYVQDLEQAYAEVTRKFPGVPIYLQGESLGASVALQASLKGGFPHKGLILNAAPVYVNLKVGPRMPNFMASSLVWIGGLPGRVMPNYPLFPMQYESVERWIWKKAITDEFSLREIRKDPYFTHTPIAAVYVTALGKGASRIRKEAKNLRDPFIVLQGDQDHLVSPLSADYLMYHAGSMDKTARRYPKMSHTTLHDTGRGEVWQDIVDWLDMRVPGAAGISQERRRLAREYARATPRETADRLMPLLTAPVPAPATPTPLVMAR